MSKMKCEANLLKPEVWNKVNEKAKEKFAESDLGTLFLGSALNLLLFSKTHADIILEKLKELVSQDKMEKPLKLFLKITGAKNVDFSKAEIEIPLKTKDLQNFKSIKRRYVYKWKNLAHLPGSRFLQSARLLSIAWELSPS